jgi:hemerythrin
MDNTHRQFIDLVNRLGQADNTQFPTLFEELEQHTQEHFEAENRLMQQTSFAASWEHRDEHLRLLGELAQIRRQVVKGRMLLARAYVRQQLPGWFHVHALTMDSALAAHLKQLQDNLENLATGAPKPS